VLALQAEESASARGLGEAFQLVHLPPRECRAAGYADAAHASTRLDDGPRELEGRGPEHRGRIEQLEPVSEVRPVDPVALHGFRVPHALEGGRDVVPGLCPERRDEPLGKRVDVLRSDERRLDVDLRELRLTIGAQILIAEASRDLEIPVEARHHEELLVELRRLRQRVELPGVHAAGNQIVAGTLRRGLRENWRLDFQEPPGAELAARRLQQPVPKHQVALQLGATEVEIAVAQPQLLGGQRLSLGSGHGNGGRDSRPDDANRARLHFHIAGGQLRVPARFRAGGDLTLHEHDALLPYGGGRTLHRVAHDRRIEGDLHDALTVAQVDEDQPAEVSLAVHPPAQPDRPPRIREPQRAAIVGAQRRARLRRDGHARLTRRNTTAAADAPASAPVVSATQSKSSIDRPGMNC